MEIISIVMDSHDVFFQWKMVMMFKKFPSTPLYGCTKLTLGDDNRIIYQRDYFDLWGTILNGIPILRRCLLEIHAQVLRVTVTSMKLPEELQFIANARMTQKTTAARMDGRVCVITGATSGVGYQAAKRLAQGGAHLVMVCRNGEKASRFTKELEHEYGYSRLMWCRRIFHGSRRCERLLTYSSGKLSPHRCAHQQRRGT